MTTRLPLAIATLFVLLTPGALARPDAHWFRIDANPDFADVRAQLQVVVDEHARHAENRFCVVGQGTGAEEQAWVYWPEENKRILWLPDHDNPHAIAGSKRYLDLARDVVPGNDVHGSTDLMTRHTVDEKIRACRQHGETFLIDKSASTPTADWREQIQNRQPGCNNVVFRFALRAEVRVLSSFSKSGHIELLELWLQHG